MSVPDSERRRERARVAQRRSRAQRQATFEALQRRTAVLSNALHDLASACLDFSNVVITGRQEVSPATLLRELKPLIARALESARISEEAQDTTLDEVADSPPLQAIVRRPNTTGYETSTSLPGPVPLTSSWPFSWWDPVFPKDILVYLPSVHTHAVSLSMVLFWNALRFAHNALHRPQSDLTQRLFKESLRFEDPRTIISRMQRRLDFAPSQLLVSSLLNNTPYPSRETSQRFGYDIDNEAQSASRLRSMIEMAMASSGESAAAFLNATGVEDHLRSKWGISFSTIDTPETRSSVAMNPSQISHIPIASDMIEFLDSLTLRARCLGNSIGFPIKAIDEAALQYHANQLSTQRYPLEV
ncbi:hypothetical protein ANO11243_080540 [Dothideomycetidae sp. 11243]|nr:hypothetical protein ANO11243_080540 [fungal sp. No.11243]